MRSLFSLAVLTSSFFWIGCASAPWTKFPIKEKPDHTCQTGVESGRDVYIWNCRDGRHTVVHQMTSIFFLFPMKLGAKQETAACGQLTVFEKEHDFVDGKSPECRRTDLEWTPVLEVKGEVSE